MSNLATRTHYNMTDDTAIAAANAPRIDANGNVIATESQMKEWLAAVIRLYLAGKATIDGVPPVNQNPLQNLLTGNGLSGIMDKVMQFQMQMAEFKMSMTMNNMYLSMIQNMFNGFSNTMGGGGFDSFPGPQGGPQNQGFDMSGFMGDRT